MEHTVGSDQLDSYLLPKRNGAERTRVFHANLTQLWSTRAPGCRRGGPRGVSLIPISHQCLDGTRGAERRNAFPSIRLIRLDAREVDDTQRVLGWAWYAGFNREGFLGTIHSKGQRRLGELRTRLANSGAEDCP
ncbi:hypothetical protein R1flu_010745 [Riccia fluitans]|uniref:Uncharacterized protein n=1 Tax=Riccia fluitans TaxID=41844 RepID=A0ABD1Z6S5_9MARC